jgi:hypothetical protein
MRLTYGKNILRVFYYSVSSMGFKIAGQSADQEKRRKTNRICTDSAWFHEKRTDEMAHT